MLLLTLLLYNAIAHLTIKNLIEYDPEFAPPQCAQKIGDPIFSEGAFYLSKLLSDKHLLNALDLSAVNEELSLAGVTKQEKAIEFTQSGALQTLQFTNLADNVQLSPSFYTFFTVTFGAETACSRVFLDFVPKKPVLRFREFLGDSLFSYGIKYCGSKWSFYFYLIVNNSRQPVMISKKFDAKWYLDPALPHTMSVRYHEGEFIIKLDNKVLYSGNLESLIDEAVIGSKWVPFYDLNKDSSAVNYGSRLFDDEEVFVSKTLYDELKTEMRALHYSDLKKANTNGDFLKVNNPYFSILVHPRNINKELSKVSFLLRDGSKNNTTDKYSLDPVIFRLFKLSLFQVNSSTTVHEIFYSKNEPDISQARALNKTISECYEDYKHYWVQKSRQFY